MAITNTSIPVTNWAPIRGIWSSDSAAVTYFGSDAEQTGSPSAIAIPLGIALSDVKFAEGKARATVFLPSSSCNGAAQVVLGFSSWESRFVSVGLRGITPGPAFVMAEHNPGVGWRDLTSAGLAANLVEDRPYSVEVRLEGQRLTLSVDGIKVLDHVLSGLLSQEQLGLYSQGTGQVKFESVEVSSQPSKAFVVMQFTDPFNELFEEVIRPTCEDAGAMASRALDISQPGVILQDILQRLDESNVVIADVTPANPNVFYELGYSHALRKPVILLAERNTKLPFDISGYRVIFYDNTIGGKSAVEAELRQHLTSILGH